MQSVSAGVPPALRWAGVPPASERAGVSPAGLESAGGIGGLLAVHDVDDPNDPADPFGDFVFCYDANGNVGQLVAWATGYGGAQGDEWHADRLVAHYEYDPYGGVTAQSGTYAAANPVRFSTKYWDDETGLGYWGCRYYSPSLGRWVNRDPIEEPGGFNVYRYCRNDALGKRDALGRLAFELAWQLAYEIYYPIAWLSNPPPPSSRSCACVGCKPKRFAVGWHRITGEADLDGEKKAKLRA